ncbi:MAG: hypothetical protein HN981_04755 [Candidatus Pacebacteria bacterium]|nr:hypothetical protein [Candidatus Paceibacterota bacterium]MBT4652058.1 hypothetical protein [Candidatus Paceibacterota bacterium]MBT6756080.1 hypothetical protein [Candidatus Paceibacterota bacterium]MBT6921673.1 hypothetical protein [Candidatus Paceibacterota bacterium]
MKKFSLKKSSATILKQPIWLILIFSFLLRIPLLTGSFWLDEAAQALESIRPFSQQLDIIPDFQPPLLHYITHFAASVSETEWWLRLWGALIPGLVTIWATYKIGKKLFSERVGQWAALLLATSSFHIFYSQELRPYSLPAMWGMLSTLTLLTRPLIIWKFILLSVAGLYSSYLYPFLLFTQLVIMWLKYKSPQKLFQTILPIILLFIPWLPRFLQQLQAGQSLRLEIPGWENAVSIPQIKTLVLVPLKFIFGVLNIEPTWTFILAILVLSFLCVKLFLISQKSLWINLINALKKIPKLLRKNKLKLTPKMQLIILIILPFLSAWIISFLVPVLRPKRVLFLLPFFYLLFASLLPTRKLGSLLYKNQEKITIYLLSTLLFINLWGTISYWHEKPLQRENWRELKQEIVTTFPASSTLVIMSFDEPFAPWRWYLPEYPTLDLGYKHASDVENMKDTLKPAFDKDYVLVFDYLRTLTDPDDLILQTLSDFGFIGRGVIDYPGIGFVRIYTRSHNALGSARL